MQSRRYLPRALPLVMAAHVAACGGGDEMVSPTTGVLVVTTSTAGADIDPDGYTLQIGNQPVGIAPSATVQVPDLPPGQYSISLGGIAANCTVAGSAQRVAVVQDRDTSRVQFAIACVTRGPAATSSHILFEGFLDGVLDLYVMNADGDSVRDLEADIEFAGFPSLSPDGKTVAFDRFHDDDDHLVIRSLTGKDDREIPAEFFYGPSAWSRDGSKLALVASSVDVPSSTEIWVVNRDGTGLRMLTHLGGLNTDPSWSPDGTQLVLVHEDSVVSVDQAYLVDADGSNPRQLTDIEDGVARPAWSPDGSRIAFDAWSSDGGESDIFVMPPIPGATVTRLTFEAGLDQSPSWSPDGTRLAFASDRVDKVVQIFSMDADGSHQVQLTHTTGFSANSPDWEQ